MAFNKFGKFIFPAVVTIFTVDTLLPTVSPLQVIPVFQGEFANAFEGAGREVEKTTREGTKYIVFSSFESKEISNQNGIKRCRVLANTVSNTMTGGANYITHNYIVNIKNGHVTVE